MGKLKAYGVGDKFLRVCRELYSSVSARVRIGQTLSEAFRIACGLRQGGTVSMFVFIVHYGSSRGIGEQGTGSAC